MKLNPPAAEWRAGAPQVEPARWLIILQVSAMESLASEFQSLKILDKKQDGGLELSLKLVFIMDLYINILIYKSSLLLYIYNKN
jgi:hypothetical protein